MLRLRGYDVLPEETILGNFFSFLFLRKSRFGESVRKLENVSTNYDTSVRRFKPKDYFLKRDSYKEHSK